MAESQASKNRGKKIEIWLGDRIKEFREKRVMSHAELSRRADVSPSHLTRIEAGRQTISIRTLEKLVHGLGVGMAEFFSENTEVSSPGTQRLYRLVEVLRDRDEETLETVETIVRQVLNLVDRDNELKS